MNNNDFKYTYSAPEQAEIKKIREKYLPKEETENKLERLRKLDRSAENPAVILSLVLGTIGTLLLGVGMCCTMVWKDYFILGIIVGIVGIGVLSCAYPVYKKLLRKGREKVAPEILRLTEELEK